jgi:hypothetical protein
MSRRLPDAATGAHVKALIPKGRGKRLRLFGRGLALAVLLVSILAACGSEPPDSPPPDDPPPASSFDESPSTRAPAPGLTFRGEQVGDYHYRIFTPAAESRFGLTLTRPSADDSEILLSVAGTYTSPDDDVLGVVLIDGVEERSQRMGWGGALVLVDGQAEVRSLPGGRLEPAERKALEAQRVSLIQGHLLVHGGRASSLKPSQPLQRRAVALLDGAAVIVESEGLVELGPLRRAPGDPGRHGSPQPGHGEVERGLVPARRRDGPVPRARPPLHRAPEQLAGDRATPGWIEGSRPALALTRRSRTVRDQNAAVSAWPEMLPGSLR